MYSGSPGVWELEEGVAGEPSYVCAWTRSVVCVEEGLGGNCGEVLLWRKVLAHPGLFSEKVMSPVNSRAFPVVISLRNLVPET